MHFGVLAPYRLEVMGSFVPFFQVQVEIASLEEGLLGEVGGDDGSKAFRGQLRFSLALTKRREAPAACGLDPRRC